MKVLHKFVLKMRKITKSTFTLDVTFFPARVKLSKTQPRIRGHYPETKAASWRFPPPTSLSFVADGGNKRREKAANLFARSSSPNTAVHGPAYVVENALTVDLSQRIF